MSKLLSLLCVLALALCGANAVSSTSREEHHTLLTAAKSRCVCAMQLTSFCLHAKPYRTGHLDTLPFLSSQSSRALFCLAGAFCS
jgi:hypothetical protein